MNLIQKPVSMSAGLNLEKFNCDSNSLNSGLLKNYVDSLLNSLKPNYKFLFSIWDALAREILDAYANTGRAVAKKIEYHRKMFIIIF